MVKELLGIQGVLIFESILLRVLSGFGILWVTAPWGRVMEGFAHRYELCPNEACPDTRKLQNDPSKPNLKKIGFTRGGVQPYQCKTSNGAFTETHGTIFYRKRMPNTKCK